MPSGVVLDDAGRLFWVEADLHGGVELVSLDADGTPRFRKRLAASRPDFIGASAGGLFVAGALVVVGFQAPGACDSDRWIQAWSVDGTLVWSRTLGAAPAAGATCTLAAGGMASNGSAILVLARRCETSSAGLRTCAGTLRAFAIDGGDPLWSIPADIADVNGYFPPLPSPIADEDGNAYVYLRTDRPEALAEIVSVGRDGTVRYRRGSSPSYGVVATASGALLSLARAGGDGYVLDRRSGDVALTFPYDPYNAAAVGTALFAVVEDRLARLSLSTGEEAWGIALPPRPPPATSPQATIVVQRVGPTVTEAGTLLLVEQFTGYATSSPAVLHEVDVSGQGANQVVLAGTQAAGYMTLGDGQLFVWSSSVFGGSDVLHAYPVPGRRPAPHGWIGAGAGPRGDGRAH